MTMRLLIDLTTSVYLPSLPLLEGEAEALPVTFRQESRGVHHGQTDMTLLAISDGRTVGKVDYVMYQDEISIQMIKADPAFPRRRIGTSMIKHLQSLYPDTELEWGMMTPDGVKLHASLPMERRSDPEIVAKIARLEQVKAQLAAFQTQAEAFDADPTEEKRVAMVAIGDEWNQLHDEEYELESELNYTKSHRTIIRY